MKSDSLLTQPLYIDDEGVARFRHNPLICYLADRRLNDLSITFPPNEYKKHWSQLAQLLGYSIGGFGDLSYVSDEEYLEADAEVEKLRQNNEDHGREGE